MLNLLIISCYISDEVSELVNHNHIYGNLLNPVEMYANNFALTHMHYTVDMLRVNSLL